MSTLAHILIFCFGLIVGSFLNVAILRYNTGAGLRGRSRCLACARTLRWPELLPLFSFAIQRGRCRSCSSKISWQYPVVEGLTGLLFILIFTQFGSSLAALPLLLAHLVIASLLVVILVYDFRHKIIPDGLVFAFVGLALLSGLLDFSLLRFVNHLLAGGLIFGFFYLLWRVSRGRWMGFGDAKLGLGVGFLLGLAGGISAIVFAFWIGAVVSLVLMGLSRALGRSRWRSRLSFQSEIPFAPFIILGLWLNLFFSLYVSNFF